MKKKYLLFDIFCVLLGIVGYNLFPEKKLSPDTVIDKLVVYKEKRQLQAFSHGVLMKTYTVSLGRNPIGHKECEGDMKTPEGIYHIDSKNPHSGYHKNLGISYPNTQDESRTRQLGKSAGGDIKIHGLRNGTAGIDKFHRWVDWTHGCIAVTNEEMDELYNSVEIGAVIEILP